MIDYLSPHDDADLRELSRSVRKFAEDRFEGTDEIALRFQRDDFTAMGSLGLTGIVLPEQYGGSALGSSALAACIFEIARCQLGPAIYLSVHLMVSRLIERWSKNDTHAALLTSFASGDNLAAFCLTEANAGSDAAALQTKAVKTENGFRISGEKIYITSAGLADTYLVFAKSSTEDSKEISAFVIPADTPGLSFGAQEKKMGCEGSPIASVRFENCAVPQTALLGELGQGFRIALSGLDGGRVNIAAAACGIASRAIELAVSHVKERKQFGRPLKEFQGLQFMLADMAMQLRAAVLLTRDAAAALDAKGRASTEAALAKCAASDAAMKITTDAVQLLGGAGYLQDYQVERLMRGAKMLQIVEGTNQIQRVLIARGLLND